jgi:fimbrial isopeptide formation D2 family protein
MTEGQFFRMATRAMAGLLLTLFSSIAIAQVCTPPANKNTNFVGNAYYPGTGTATAGTRTVTVGTVRALEGGAAPTGTYAQSTNAIAANDLVFIIQMQDATLVNANDDTYGDGVAGGFGQGTNDLRSTGRYEFGVVQSVAGGTITLRDNLKFTYTSAASSGGNTRRTFQIIRVNQNSNLTLSSSYSVVPWDGFTGGVFVLDVSGTLNFGGQTINANGAGFRGGGSNAGAGSGGTSVEFFTSTNNSNNWGGMKGEGIAGTPRLIRGTANVAFNGVSSGLAAGDDGYPSTNDRSRGAPGNAGGGGNQHNSGGGGGSNSGQGGKGGYSFGFYRTTATGTCRTLTNEVSPFETYYACDGDGSRDVGGNPGGTLAPSADRVILGGGGGAGDNNNADDNSATPQASGGNGGGLIFVRASAVSGSGTLTATGQDGQPAGRDGAGGGGAGGTIALAIPNPQTPATLNLNISVKGGKGGDSGLPLRANEAQGPGGAGGGGSVLKPTNVSFTTAPVVSGGDPGKNRPVAGVENKYGTEAGGGAQAPIDYQPVDLPNSNACYSPNISKATTTPVRVQNQQTTATYTITLTQPSNRFAISGVNVVDDLPSPLTAPAGTTAAITYGGGASGPSSLIVSGTDPVTIGTAGGTAANSFTMPAGSTVTIQFTVDLNGAAPGTYANSATVNSRNAESNLAVVGGPASANVAVIAPPTLSKAFSTPYIAPGGTSRLTITLTNPTGTQATLTSNLVDSLPAGVIIAATPDIQTTCTGSGTITTAAGPPVTITVPSGRIIPPNASCTVSVNVTASTPGLYTNTIPAGGLVTDRGNSPTAATAPLVVLEPAKSVRLLIDADGSGNPTAGDTLRYTLTYTLPAGAPTINNFQIFDILPTGLTKIAGAGNGVTVTPSGGATAVEDTAYTGVVPTSSLLQAGATLVAGSTVIVEIDATINAGATAGTVFDNTARATGSNLPPVTGSGAGGGIPSDADAPSGSLPQPQDTPGGTEPTRVTVGFVPRAISGRVYKDLDKNGSQNGNDPGFQGVVVTLRDSNGNDIDSDPNTAGVQPTTTTTDSSGNYSFPNRAPGTYQVVETQPTGFGSSETPTNTGTVTIPGSGSGAVAGPNFGEIAGSLSGTVYRDDNDNGTKQAAEPGLQGVTLQLLDSSGNPVDIDPVTAGVQSTVVTDANGNYTFPNVPGGTGYRIVETQPTGYLDGKETAGTAGGTVSSTTGNAAADNTINGITVPTPASTAPNDPSNATGYLFGERGQTITGKVYKDLNKNNTQDGSDPGFAGVTVTLRDSSGNDIDSDPNTAGVQPTTTTTDASGNYSFPNLAPGSYRVVETQPTGFGSSETPTNTANVTVPAVAAANGVVTGPNFGEIAGSLSGTVYRDDDDNGVKLPTEPGIAGVTLQLLDSSGNPVDIDPVTAGVQSTVVTDANGNYTFPNVPGGNGYQIRETQPAGFADGKETVGSAGGTVPTTTGNAPADNTITGINLPTPATTAPNDPSNATGYLFGERGTPVTGTVFVDTNNNGTRDPGEPPLGGVTVELRDGNGNPIDSDPNTAGVQPTTATTNASGNYSFPGLPAGNYQVVETQPAGLGSSTPNTVPVTLVAGTPATVNFGEIAGSLSGTVFRDDNNDGVKLPTEPGIAGVSLQLLDSSGNPVDIDPVTAGVQSTVVTDANGNYTFPNVPAGSGYQIRETQPSAYSDGQETAGTAGGTVPTTTGNAPVNNTITGITLPTATGAANDPANATGYLFGERGTAISGTVYRDDSRDSTQQGSEPGIQGVTLTLKDGNGNDIDSDPNTAGVQPTTATTDASGNYSFPNLPAGNYQVVETQPTGYGSSPASPNTVPVTLTAGTPGTANFGDTLGSLSGRVFRDPNDDGVQLGAAETGIQGVTLQIQDGNGNAVDIDPATAGVQSTVVTNANGDYTFPNLLAGTYRIVETQPPCCTDGKETVGTINGTPSGTAPTTTGNDPASNTISAINVPAGGQGTGYNFADIPRGGLSGTVFVDRNRNGTQDVGDSGLQGVTITVRDSSGNDIDSDPNTAGVQPTTATTDASGNYSFPNLPAGNYQVVETQPTGYGSSATTPNTQTVTIPAGGSGTVNFGDTLSTISGTVYRDDNDNGAKQTTEPGIAGVTLTLKDSSGNDVDSDPATPGVQPTTTTTDSSGNYSFPNLLAGTYQVVETQPTAYVDGKETAGPAGGTVPTTTGNAPANNTISSIPVGAGVDATGYLFGDRGTPISGTVFRDDNRNGTQTAGEPGIQGVTVELRDGNGNPIDSDPNTAGVQPTTATTLADGSYTFQNLPAGNYQVVETQPTGYGSSTPNTVPVTLVAGTPGTANFGDTLSSLSGSVYADNNDNGVRDPGEAGIAGVTLQIQDGNGNAVDIDPATAGVQSTVVTDANGDYAFPNLLAGTYRIVETQPAQFQDGKETAGTFSGTVPTTTGNAPANNTISAITVPAGQVGTGYLFGERGTGISGTVFRDLNKNGSRDAGEPGIAGVPVELRDGSGNPIDSDPGTPGVQPTTATTDSSGNYSFPNLPAGNYQVVETQPAGLGSSTPNTVPVTLTAGTTSTVNFGEIAGSLSGTVYRDDNDNGTKQAAEPGLQGVTLQLLDSSGNPVDIDPVTAGVQSTVVTDANGNYTFPNVPGGNGYQIRETQPSSFADGRETAGTAGGTAPTTTGNDPASNTITSINLPTPATTAANDPSNASGYLFGERGTPVTGTVFVDTNNNGTRDPGEPPLGGVTVELRDGNGNPIDSDPNTAGVQPTTATTDSSGNYSFPNLPAGSYQVVETQPAAYGSSTPNTVPVAVVAGTPATVNFGEKPGSVQGFVYNDINDNGSKDAGENGIAGVTVTLKDGNGNDIDSDPNTAGVQPTTVITDQNGSYTFINLPAGTYRVVETQPANVLDGKDTAGTAGGTTAVKNEIRVIALTPGLDATGYLFGERGQVGSVVGRVFRDDNGNGSQGASEPGLAGVQVRITNGAFSQVVTTDANGNYRLDNVPVGTATVDVIDSTLPAGVTQTAGVDPSAVTVLLNQVNDAGADGYRLPPPVATSNSATTALNTPVTFPITGDDSSAPGTTIDPSSVDLDPSTPGQQKERTVPEGKFTVDPSGNVNFTPNPGVTGPVTPIQYTVSDSTGAISNPATLSVTVGPATRGDVTGVVFRDDNGNGTQDPSEPGIPNVSALVTNGSFSQTAVTDANGKYTAVGVPTGTATVDVVDSTLPAGLTQTAGQDPSTVTVVAGQSNDAGKDGYRPKPPVAVGDSATTPVNTPVTIPVLGNDNASPPNTLDPSSVTFPTAGQPQGATVTNNGKTLTVPNEGTYEVQPDGTVRFTPTPGFTGTTTPVVYTVNDNRGQPSNPAPITVSVGAPNKGNVAGTVFEDRNGNGTQDPNELGLPNVSVTVTNGSFTQTVVTDSSGKYTAVGVPVGTATVDVDNATLPAPLRNNQTAGTDPSTVAVVAGQTVDAGKDGYRAPPPVATSDSATTQPNTPVTLPGATNDTPGANGGAPVDPTSVDLDLNTPGDQKIRTVPEGTYTANPDGTVTFTPNPGVTGSVTPIQYTVRDTNGNTSNPATLSVTIGAPTKGSVTGTVFRDDNGNGTQDPNEPGLPNVSLTVTNGSFTQTVVTDSSGKYTAVGVPVGTATVDVVDSTLPAGLTQTAGTDPSTVTVVAGQTADAGVDGYRPNPPVAVNDSAATPVNTPVTIPVLGNDSASNPRTLDRSSVTFPTAGQPQGATVTNNGKTLTVPNQGTFEVQPNGSVLFTPVSGFTGPVSPVKYTVNDSAGNPSNPATINVTVGPAGTLSGVVFRDDNGNGQQDPSEPGLSSVQVKVTNPNGFDQTVTTDAQGRYTVPGVPLGTATVSVVKSTLPPGVNQTAGTDPNDVTVVAGNNDAGIDGYRLAPPRANDDSRTTPLDTPVTFSITGNDTASNPYNVVPSTVDLDPSTPAVETSRTVPEGTFVVNGVGEVTFTPNPGFSGKVTEITYTVLDSTGQKSNPARINVTVLPTSSDDTATTPQGQPVNINVLANDRGNLDPSTVKVQTPPTNGTVVVNPDGTITYTPRTGFSGTDTFTYQVCDTGGSCTTSKVTVTVTPRPAGSLTGKVFEDTNGNGSLEPTEPGIPGAKVELFELKPDGTPDFTKPIRDVNGNPLTATTDQNGNYSFPSVPPGGVAVRVTDPAGKVLTTNNNPQTVTVQANVANTAAPVGYVTPKINLTLTPEVQIVTPGDNLPYTAVVTNNTPGGITPLQDPTLTVQLPKGVVFDPTKPVTVDGVPVPAANVSVKPDPTDPARQILTIKLPNELKNNVPQTVKFNTIVTPAVDPTKPLVAVGEATGRATNGTTTVSVSSGAVAAAAVKVNLGVFSNETIIVGRVYFDANNNNNFDAGDTPLAGARVYLSDGRYAVTDGDGRYSIPGLKPGTYAVRLDPVTAPYTVKRVPDDQGAPGTRYVRAADAGGITTEDFLLESPRAAAVKSRSTTVQRGPVSLTKAITQGGAGYVVTMTITVTQAVRDLAITDPLPAGATRGPLTGATLEGNVLRLPGVTQPGTYTITYALFTALPPDLALTDPDINYQQIFTMIPISPPSTVTSSPPPGGGEGEPLSNEVSR